MSDESKRPSDADFAYVREAMRVATFSREFRRVIPYLLALHGAKTAPVEVPEDVLREAREVMATPDRHLRQTVRFARAILSLASPPAPEPPKPRAVWQKDETMPEDRNTEWRLQSDAASYASIWHVLADDVPKWRLVQTVDTPHGHANYEEVFPDADLAAAKRRAEELAGVTTEEDGPSREWLTRMGAIEDEHGGCPSVGGLAADAGMPCQPEPVPVEAKQPPTVKEAAEYVAAVLRGYPWFVSVGMAEDRLIVYVNRPDSKIHILTGIKGWQIDVVQSGNAVPAKTPGVPAPLTASEARRVALQTHEDAEALMRKDREREMGDEPAPQSAPVMTGPGVYRDEHGSGWRITDRDEEGWHTETGAARFANDGHERKVRGWVLVERVADLSRPWPKNHDRGLLAHELAAWLASEPAPQPATIVLPEPDECGDFNFPDGSRAEALWTARGPDGMPIKGQSRHMTAELAAAALRDAGFGPGAGGGANAAECR